MISFYYLLNHLSILYKGKEKLLKFIKQYDINQHNYKILNNNEFLLSNFRSPVSGELKFNNNCKHIIIEPNYFKKICLKVGTDKADKIADYYIELEKLFKFYNKYINYYNKKQLEEMKLIKSFNINKNLHEFNEYIYIVTTKSQAKENIFKIGKISKNNTLNSRLSSYNTGHVDEDKCSNSRYNIKVQYFSISYFFTWLPRTFFIILFGNFCSITKNYKLIIIVYNKIYDMFNIKLNNRITKKS